MDEVSSKKQEIQNTLATRLKEIIEMKQLQDKERQMNSEALEEQKNRESELKENLQKLNEDNDQSK